MRIALDAFGTDNAPFPEIEGAVLAVNEDFCSKVFLVGDQEQINNELKRYFFPDNSIEVIHAPEQIDHAQKPLREIKRKKDSSLMRAIKIVKEKKADGLVSAGSTGAVMAASLLKFGRIKGILRPALAISLPTINDPVTLLDVGANVDCSSDNLLQFAEMGNIYSSYSYKVKNPKIALINIGEESKKGNDVSIRTHEKLQKHDSLNFAGNIEGKDLLKGNVDVIICDGFIGNVMLKTVEGVAFSLFEILKREFDNDWIAKIGAVLSYPAFKHLKKKVDYTEYGGAFLLGVNAISIIGHGRSNAKAIYNAIKLACSSAKSNFLDHLRDYYNNSNGKRNNR